MWMINGSDRVPSRQITLRGCSRQHELSSRMHHGGHLMEPIKLFSSEEATRCYNCGKSLGGQRCAGNTPQGPKWFCRQEPGSDPFESCYSHWRMRQSRQAS